MDSDRQWGWYRGIASWHALCASPNDARLLSPVGLFRGVAFERHPLAISRVKRRSLFRFTMGSSMRPRANRFENAHVRNDKTKFILYATVSIKVIEVPPSRCTRLSFSRCSHIEQRVTLLRNANGFQVDVNRGGVQEDRRDRILKIGIQ